MLVDRTVDRKEYSEAVIAFIRLAQQRTAGGRVAAQVLLSAYNGYDFQLNIVDLGSLAPKNYELAITIIRGRYETGLEPHALVKDGSRVFGNLWDKWRHLHVEERGKQTCPTCDGRGTQYLNQEDEEDMRTKPCARCNGEGRICRCRL